HHTDARSGRRGRQRDEPRRRERHARGRLYLLDVEVLTVRGTTARPRRQRMLRITWRRAAGLVSLAALALLPSGAWAGPAGERQGALAQQTRSRLTTLRERVAAVRPQNPQPEALANAARLQLALAQKSLVRRNTRGAQVLAASAERLTALAEGQ